MNDLQYSPTGYAAAGREEFWRPWQGRELFVGFSGGADSTAALLLTVKAAEKWDIRVTAVHFDHGLRGKESAAEADAAGAFAAERQIAFRRIDLHLEAGSSDLENRARQARIRAWQRLTAASPGSAVVLGHHADDRVESLFLRLCRGSNVSGLVSPRMVAEVEGVTFIRPLLNRSREEIESFLQENGVSSWNEDSSNKSSDFNRNWLRNELLPGIYQRIPGSRTGLKEAVAALETDADYLENEAKHLFLQPGIESFLFWRTLHPALFVRVLRLLCGGVVPPPEAVARLRAELNRGELPEPRRIPVTDGIEILLQHDSLSLLPPEPPAEICWNWKKENTISWGRWVFEVAAGTGAGVSGTDEAVFDSGFLPDELVISAPQPGDTLIPFGSTSPVKLKKLRTDRRIPSLPVLPVLRDASGKVLWAPFIRHSCHGKVPSGGKSVIIRIFDGKKDC